MRSEKSYKRAPGWAYVVGGLILLPFLVGYILGLFGMRFADIHVQPWTLSIAGAVLGWIASQTVSKK
jgi:hypothetical protein